MSFDYLYYIIFFSFSNIKLFHYAIYFNFQFYSDYNKKKKKDTNKKDSNHSHKVGKPKINLSLENLNSHMSYKTPTMAIELVDQELDK